MADTLWQHLRWDLVVLDKDEQPVLAVVVKAMPNAFEMAIEWLKRIESEMRSTGHPVPYWMFVDLETVIVFSFVDQTHPVKVELQVSSKTVLGVYEPEFGQKRIFEEYLSFLVETWLQELVSNGNSAHPVLRKEFTEIGLAARLEGGTILREVSIADLDFVRRNQLHHESLPGSRLFD
jgi:hypothetical protein